NYQLPLLRARGGCINTTGRDTENQSKAEPDTYQGRHGPPTQRNPSHQSFSGATDWGRPQAVREGEGMKTPAQSRPARVAGSPGFGKAAYSCRHTDLPGESRCRCHQHYLTTQVEQPKNG